MRDPLVVVEATGEVILQVLENSVSKYPSLEGRFPQVRYPFLWQELTIYQHHYKSSLFYFLCWLSVSLLPKALILLYEILDEPRGVTRGAKMLCELYPYKL